MSNKENEKPITLLEGRELVLTGESADKFLEALENPRSVEVVDVDRSKGLKLLRKRFGVGQAD